MRIGAVLVCGVCILASGGISLADQHSHPIVRDRETLDRWVEDALKAPPSHIDRSITPARGHFDLLPYFCYIPAEWNQGACGNCAVWASTGCLQIALAVQEYECQLLSTQYVNSCWWGTFPCCGFSISEFCDFCNSTGQAIAWSNPNAYWRDGDEGCVTPPSSVPCCSIAQGPVSYGIFHAGYQWIYTYDVGQTTAISNLKNVLNQNKGVFMQFFLPRSADWTYFREFWDNHDEDFVWDPAPVCSHTWVHGEGGGHAVLCVGYDDSDPDPGKHHWIFVNSWGTTPQRPQGIFRMKMDMDYGCYSIKDGFPFQTFGWLNLDVSFTTPHDPDPTCTPRTTATPAVTATPIASPSSTPPPPSPPTPMPPSPPARLVLNGTLFGPGSIFAATFTLNDPILVPFSAYAVILPPSGGMINVSPLNGPIKPLATMAGLTAPFEYTLLSTVVPGSAEKGEYEIVAAFFDQGILPHGRGEAFMEAAAGFQIQ
jgi:hypothetical protein